MKTIAIPLLLASSAKAAGGKRPEMDRDHGVPAPVLIAASVAAGACQDSANLVSGAESALTQLKTESTQLITDHETELAEVATAQATVAEKIAAVTSLAATHDVSIAADDAAQAAKLTADRVWNEKTYEEAIALTASTAAAAAVTAQTAEQTARTALVAALLEAKTEAQSHYDAEVTARGAVTASGVVPSGTLGALEAATTALSTEEAATAGLTTTRDNAQSAWDTLVATKATKLVLKTTAAAELAEALVIKTAYESAIDSSVASSAAYNEAQFRVDDGSSAVDWFTLDGLITSKSTTWQTAAQLTVTELNNWHTSTTYTALALGSGCVDQSVTAVAQGSANTHLLPAACEALCEAKLSWTMDVTVPNGAITADGAYCYGYEFVTTVGSTVCSLQTGAAVTVGTSKTDATCYVRDKTTKVAAYIAARDLSKDSATAYTDVTTAWDNALTVRTNLQALKRLVDVATAVNTKWQAKYGADNTAGYWGASTTADTAYATAATAADTATAVAYTTTLANAISALSTNATNIGTKTTTKTDANTADGLVVIEIAAQLTTKTLADAQYATANTAMLALHTSNVSGVYAATQVNTDAAAAATALTNAGTATSTALGTQSTTTSTASGTATTASAGRALLVTARAETTSAYTALASKQTDAASALSTLNSKKAEIAAKDLELQGLIAACEAKKYDEYAAALVTAQETRQSNLAAIEKLISTAETNAPAAGAAGYRCEKAVSFGTQRPARGETTCAAELCCGAARIPLPGQASTTLTVETCQPLATTTFDWTPPRQAMAVVPTAAVNGPFACIDGARKLAAAASVLATAVYMLA